jgi:hypothetical protein
MEEDYIISRLEDLGLDIGSVESFELSQFLDLTKDIKQEDYDKGLEYVLSRRNLENTDAFGKFKYFCGYLQKIKRVYKLQEQYQNEKTNKIRE